MRECTSDTGTHNRWRVECTAQITQRIRATKLDVSNLPVPSPTRTLPASLFTKLSIHSSFASMMKNVQIQTQRHRERAKRKSFARVFKMFWNHPEDGNCLSNIDFQVSHEQNTYSHARMYKCNVFCMRKRVPTSFLLLLSPWATIGNRTYTQLTGCLERKIYPFFTLRVLR